MRSAIKDDGRHSVVADAMLSSAGFSPVPSRQKPDDLDADSVDTQGPNKTPPSPDSIAKRFEDLYEAAQDSRVYLDATGRLLSVEEITALKSRASQEIDLGRIDKQDAPDSEKSIDRNMNAPVVDSDEPLSAPVPHSSAPDSELRG